MSDAKRIVMRMTSGESGLDHYALRVNSQRAVCGVVLYPTIQGGKKPLCSLCQEDA